jgi:hypothetical protein
MFGGWIDKDSDHLKKLIDNQLDKQKRWKKWIKNIYGMRKT